MSAGYPALLVALLVLVPVAAAGSAPAATGPHPAVESDSATWAPTPNTTMRVSVRSNGDARWTVTARFNLSTTNETESFQDLARAYEAGETSTLGLPAFRAASTSAAEGVNRSMTIQSVERLARPTAGPDNGTGLLILEFTWTNFARVENDTLLVGDVFRTGDRNWLPGLEPNQRLVIEPPSRNGVVQSNVPPENGTLRWSGPATFEADELRAVFTRGAGVTGPGGEQSGLPVMWMGLGILALGGGVLAVYAVTRSRWGDDQEGQGSGGPTGTPPDDTGSEPVEGGAGDPTADVEPDDAGDDVDQELLSDEERIEHLLEQNGGRMKQANIVSETGWSNAKVSQLLSSMDDEGRIDKLRIGRENLISFPDEDVTDFEE